MTMKKNKLASLSLVVAMVVVLSADAIGDDYGDPDVPEGTAWCVANPAADPEQLRGAYLFACSLLPHLCKALTPGQPWYMPFTLVSHASFVFNSWWSYFSKNATSDIPCDYGGNGFIVTSDPSNLSLSLSLSLSRLLNERVDFA
ncbi:hypothetical protein L7F22_067327 [Adiantum nelumboides]|nr:hypothetical protein [Adiantum nelumboides]